MKERDYDAEIAALAYERDIRRVSASLAGKLAILIHDHTCGCNHTDGCGWLYEIHNGLHDWKGGDHASHIYKAEAIIGESLTLQDIQKRNG